ncbi:PhyH-domain-containing protein [Aureobasidium pullulans]|uniref:PhyH-domain-containing protein n=1 Tax=Aureobasidium pullulans TaxID=5580 RepID=A0A4S9X9S9_AURPU|nr:PhyH-domain-containing protein [Aureobasidium pullulans]THZ49166.1 PhyH-domain-containing protein [Aureobasidium pullulans]THZ57414.1 PhyH-domain-containing protein [Aureobasidium pullulans]THZ75822.1 PhyH-domain-containing protein [Aureobasidium pullulans]
MVLKPVEIFKRQRPERALRAWCRTTRRTATIMSPHANSEAIDSYSPPPAKAAIPSRLYAIADTPKVSSLANICDRSVTTKNYPLASEVQKNIPIYNLAKYNSDKTAANNLQDEWYEVLANGPGVFVVQNMYSDQPLLDETNEAFHQIIEREKSHTKGDHFAAGGKNDRIWNSFSKHGLQDPSSFVKYYSNPWLARVCEAWLGQQYRVTAQTNIVKPGGAAQVSHRDYHLGFQTAEGCSRFPRGMQHASQFLTLQGAVAQSDMPLESGPTRFLPFSQKLDSGFMAYRLPEFDQYFNENWVSLPLRKGDGVFFNPALHHAAGNNTSQVDRSANLLQISSAFGKPMEQIDSIPLVKVCWPEIQQLYKAEGLSDRVETVIAAIGEGYPFPTNLDNRPPAPNGMAPANEQDVIREAITSNWDTEKIVSALTQMRVDGRP